MDAVSDKRAVDGPADAPTWAVAVGVVVLLLLLSSLGLIAAGGWKWFADFLVSAAPNWIQAVGSIAAIVAAGLFIKWQMEEQARRTEIEARGFDTRRLQLIWVALAGVRESVEILRVPSLVPHQCDGEVETIKDQLAILRAVPLIEHPDWRSFHAVASVGDAFDANYKSLLITARMATDDQHDYIEQAIQIVVVCLDEALKDVAETLRERGADVAPLPSGVAANERARHEWHAAREKARPRSGP